MRWPLALFVAGALGAQAGEPPQHSTRRPQELRLWQLPQGGLKALQQHSDPPSSDPPSSPASAAQLADRPSATRPSDRPRATGIRTGSTEVRPRHDVGARTPEPRSWWHARLTEAERVGLGPALLEHIEAEADWLERDADADLLQRLGWVLLADGLAGQAERWFALALARDPDNAAARRGLAQSLARRDELAQSYALLEPLPAAGQERRALADALAEQARARGDDVGERHWLERALAEAGGDDPSLRERLAWNAQRRQDWGEAIIFWRSLLPIENRQQWREALAAALQAQGDLAAAHQVLGGLVSTGAWRAALAGELAGRARAEASLDAERAWLEAALQDDPSDPYTSIRLANNAADRAQWGEAADHWARAYALKPDASVAEAYAGSLLRAGRADELERLALADPGPLANWWRSWQAQRLSAQGRARAAARLAPSGALPELAGVLSPRVGLGLAGRDKAGSSGGSRLRLRLAPRLSYAAPFADGWLEAELSGLRVDASEAAVSLPFGSAVAGQATVPTRVDQASSLRLRWSPLVERGPELIVGTTPAGAPVPATPTFSLGWREIGEKYAWRAALHREPVLDSVLSYAGQRDPASGMAWGRVLREGARLEGYQRLGPWSLAGSLSFGQLQGRSVADNRHLSTLVELMYDLDKEGFRFLQAGPILGWEGYQRDLSAYTWGHGGYFSPRSFTRLGAALQFETDGQPDWRLAGRVSLQWQGIRRDSAPCHPLSPPAGPSICTGDYPSANDQGLATQIELRTVVRLAPRWMLTASGGLRRGPAYRDQALGLGLLYLFEPQSRVHTEDLPSDLHPLW